MGLRADLRTAFQNLTAGRRNRISAAFVKFYRLKRADGSEPTTNAHRNQAFYSYLIDHIKSVVKEQERIDAEMALPEPTELDGVED